MGYGILNTKRVLMTLASANGISEIDTTHLNNSNSRIVFDITYETDDAQDTGMENSLETRIKNYRNMLLHGTDWWAMSDRTMTAAQTT